MHQVLQFLLRAQLQNGSEAVRLAGMRTVAWIMFVLFAVLAVTGHGAGQSIVYHAHAHDHADDGRLQNAVDTHGHDHQSSRVVAAPGRSDVSTTNCQHDQCGGDDTGAHFHFTCCVTVMALPSAQVSIAPSAVISADIPLGSSSLLLGEHRYPLLRPPRRLI
jgi:hypothetical protein